MTRQGLATGLGSLVQFWSFQFTYNDLTTAGTSQTLDLYDILSGPPYNTTTALSLHTGSAILYIRVKHSVAFSGTGITAMKVRVGKSGGATNFFTTDFDVYQAVADGTLQETSLVPMGQLSGVTPTVTFTSVGGNVKAATAGVVNIDILWAEVTTTNTTPGQSSTAVL